MYLSAVSKTTHLKIIFFFINLKANFSLNAYFVANEKSRLIHLILYSTHQIKVFINIKLSCVTNIIYIIYIIYILVYFL